jgi:hypothetical protein
MAAISCESKHGANSTAAHETSAPRHQHPCRHAGCHWKTDEARPDIKLLASSADAAIFSAASGKYVHDRSMGPPVDNDIGRNCAAQLRLQFMSGVLQI